jgi:Apea-like HEPN
MVNTAYFVINAIQCDFELPFEITENLILRKATQVEISGVENHFSQFRSSSIHGTDILWFTNQGVEIIRTKDRTQFKTVHLEEKDFRYYVFDVKRYGDDRIDSNTALRQALSISKVSFNSNIEFQYTDSPAEVSHTPSLIWYPTGISILQQNLRNDIEEAYNCKSFTENDAKKLGDVFQLIMQFDRLAFQFVYSAIENFYELQNLLVHSPFYTLSLFSIIELLLTNDGYGKSGSPSIVWQLQHKMKLINKLFTDPIDFHTYFQFGETPEKTVFEKLYKVRSQIAHGERVDFHNKEWCNSHFIKTRKLLNTFLFEFCKELIKYGLKNPVFLSDLRDC